MDQLVQGKAAVEKKLNSTDSDLRRQEEKSREAQEELLVLRQSLAQLSEREREVTRKLHSSELFLKANRWLNMLGFFFL